MGSIPRFKSDKEAAAFWDTHSLADFEKELRPAKEVVFVRPRRQVVSLRLDRKLVGALRHYARRKGIGYSSLLRMWVLERLDQEIHAHAKKKAA